MTEVLPRRALRKNASPKEISDFINDAFDGGDVNRICEAIGAAAKIHDIKRIAEQAKIARTSVYRAFSGPRLPSFQTVLHVLDAMGLQMRVTLTADVVHVPTNVVTLPPKPASPSIRGIHRRRQRRRRRAAGRVRSSNVA
jgi:probable addiction module antidote protein